MNPGSEAEEDSRTRTGETGLLGVEAAALSKPSVPWGPRGGGEARPEGAHERGLQGGGGLRPARPSQAEHTPLTAAPAHRERPEPLPVRRSISVLACHLAFLLGAP